MIDQVEFARRRQQRAQEIMKEVAQAARNSTALPSPRSNFSNSFTSPLQTFMNTRDYNMGTGAFVPYLKRTYEGPYDQSQNLHLGILPRTSQERPRDYHNFKRMRTSTDAPERPHQTHAIVSSQATPLLSGCLELMSTPELLGVVEGALQNKPVSPLSLQNASAEQNRFWNKTAGQDRFWNKRLEASDPCDTRLQQRSPSTLSSSSTENTPILTNCTRGDLPVPDLQDSPLQTKQPPPRARGSMLKNSSHSSEADASAYLTLHGMMRRERSITCLAALAEMGSSRC